jgi:AAHS family 4-hydroxybenzoate transporter-like MFS transporter
MSDMRSADRSVDVVAAIDAAKIGGFFASIVALCAAVALLDGFDILAISYVAPVIAAQWNLPTQAFGPVFAAHYVGAAVGAAVFGVLADRYGRRPTIICATAMFGLFALVTPLATGFGSLLVLRALTGIGLGGALSNAIALVSEYAPERSRASLVSLMYAAFPLGGVLGGPLSAYLVAHHGWQAVFIAGGIAPLLLIVILVAALPESLRFLVVKNAPAAKISALMRKLAPEAGYTSDCTFIARERSEVNHGPIKEIFSSQYLRATVLLCVAAFATQMVIVFVISWMPTLLKAAGLPLGRAIFASATFSLGGIVGSLLLARLIDRQRSYRSLVITFAAAAIVIGFIGFLAADAAWLFAGVAIAGITIVGAQVNLSAYSATVYPTQIRSTGLGWIIGIGRLGAIFGALLGTAFIAMGITIELQYVLAGIPALLAGAAVLLSRARHHAGSNMVFSKA